MFYGWGLEEEKLAVGLARVLVLFYYFDISIFIFLEKTFFVKATVSALTQTNKHLPDSLRNLHKPIEQTPNSQQHTKVSKP